jgi:N6-L-threonylcarbamoyladenine synthase
VADVVLGIETSCDETSAAVLVAGGSTGGGGRPAPPELASLIILSQDIHKVFGGVVPELASRAHLAALPAVVERALAEAGIAWSAVDAVAVTQGPGLVGALLVGVVYAKALAYAGDRRLIGVNHLEGHLFAPAVEDPELTPPFVALLVSGGHTLLLDVPAWGRYRLLGATRDDAGGEAFDKVGTLLHLGYPGGPAIERLAREGDPTRFTFPRPMKDEGFEFSFSGLKTAVLHAVRASSDLDRDRAHLARAFQDAALDVLVTKLERAVRATGYGTAVLGGGVACNRALAALAAERLAGRARVAVASPRLNADNAAMIARAGWWRLAQGETSDWTLDARADLPLPGLEAAAPIPHSTSRAPHSR